MIRVSEESVDQPDALALLAASDAFSRALYPPESNHLVGPEALQRGWFVVARAADLAVGCGALMPDTGWAELKRMFVSADMRGTGVGPALLAALEAIARRESFPVVRLETGIASHAALALYRRAGYREIGPFGAYAPDPLSVFMERPMPS